MIYWQLILVYLKIGMFGFGGGYAMLSLIQYEVVDHHHWLTLQQFTDVVAISQMTPGPIGINSATYVGYAVTAKRVGSCRDHHCSMSSLVHPGIAHLLLLREMQGQQIHQGGNVGTAAHVRIIDSCCCPIADEQGKFHRLQKHTYLCSRFRRDVEVEPPPYLTDNPCRSRRLPSILKKR